MNRGEFRFFHRLRVRWAEVDMQRIVFNAHYLMYFDVANADYWRALALPYEESMNFLEGDLYVKKASLEFHASARMEDLLDVGLKCSRIGSSSIAFKGGIFREETLLVDCELLYVFADPKAQASKQVPSALRDAVAAYEEGLPMLVVRTGRWDEFGECVLAVRAGTNAGKAVPTPEDADAHCIHAIAYNRLGQPVGACRIGHSTADDVPQVDRVVVHQVLRGCAVEEQVVRTMTEAAVRRA